MVKFNYIYPIYQAKKSSAPKAIKLSAESFLSPHDDRRLGLLGILLVGLWNVFGGNSGGVNGASFGAVERGGSGGNCGRG